MAKEFLSGEVILSAYDKEGSLIYRSKFKKRQLPREELRYKENYLPKEVLDDYLPIEVLGDLWCYHSHAEILEVEDKNQICYREKDVIAIIHKILKCQAHITIL